MVTDQSEDQGKIVDILDFIMESTLLLIANIFFPLILGATEGHRFTHTK